MLSMMIKREIFTGQDIVNKWFQTNSELYRKKEIYETLEKAVEEDMASLIRELRRDLSFQTDLA